LQLTAIGIFSDVTTQNLTESVSWISADNTIAVVSNTPGSQGLVTGEGVRSAAITATLNGISGSTTVTVTAATLVSIEIVPPVSSIPNGTTEQLTATGTLSDKTTQDFTNQVSWTSADNTIAQVSDAAGTKGLVTGVNLGPTTGVGSTAITATLAGISGSTTVTVTAPTLTSIHKSPP
jgi:trimeric autotransporter adhesin